MPERWGGLSPKEQSKLLVLNQPYFGIINHDQNVDWINCIYYNQQRFINYTWDAVKGTAEQLSSSNKMIWENVLALDMI